MKKTALFVKVVSIAGLLTLALLTMLGGCKTWPEPIPGAGCESACTRGNTLGCAWATPTAGGANCVTVCNEAAKVLTWNTPCISAAESCADAEACQ